MTAGGEQGTAGRCRVTPAKPIRIFEVMIPGKIEYFAALRIRERETGR